MEENNLVNYEGIDLLIKILNKSDKDNKVKKNIENLDNIVNTKFKKLLNFSNILPSNIFSHIFIKRNNMPPSIKLSKNDFKVLNISILVIRLDCSPDTI